jgi:AcrR family transcriptional regulator
MNEQLIDTGSAPGLRERKKRQTQERLTAAALQLFRERGFEGATVELIAERAEVSVTTFFRYFESKEDVFLESHRMIIDRVVAAIRERPPRVSVIAALRRVVDEVFAEQPRLAERDDVEHKAMDAVPELRDRIREYEDRIRAAITQEYATQLGVPTTDLQPRLLAGAILGAFDAARAAWIDDPRDVSLRTHVVEALDVVERMTAPILRSRARGA